MEKDIVLARGITYDECIQKVKMFARMGYVKKSTIEETTIDLKGQRIMFGECRTGSRPTSEFSVEMVKA